MRLLYIAITKGWPAALFYDQQGTDEFLDVAPNIGLHFNHQLAPRRPREELPSPGEGSPHVAAGQRNPRTPGLHRES
jgi:hypothetical protein